MIFFSHLTCINSAVESVQNNNRITTNILIWGEVGYVFFSNILSGIFSLSALFQSYGSPL